MADQFRVRGVGPVITERLQRIGITNRAGVQYFVASHGACELLRVLGVGPKKGRRILHTIGVDAGCTKCGQPISLKVLERGYRTINEGKTCGNLTMIRPTRPAPIIGRPAPIGQPYRSPLAPPIESPPPTQDYSPAGMRRSRMAANVAARAELDREKVVTRTNLNDRIRAIPGVTDAVYNSSNLSLAVYYNSTYDLSKLKIQVAEQISLGNLNRAVESVKFYSTDMQPAPKPIQAPVPPSVIILSPSSTLTTSKGLGLRAPDAALIKELKGSEEEKPEEDTGEKKSVYASMYSSPDQSGNWTEQLKGTIMDPSHVVAYLTNPNEFAENFKWIKDEPYTKKHIFKVDDILGTQNVVIEGTSYGSQFIEDILKYGGKPESIETVSSENPGKPLIVNSPKGTFLLAPRIDDNRDKTKPLVDPYTPLPDGENVSRALQVPNWVRDRNATMILSNKTEAAIVGFNNAHTGAFIKRIKHIQGVPDRNYTVHLNGNLPKPSNKPFVKVGTERGESDVELDFRGYNPANVTLEGSVEGNYGYEDAKNLPVKVPEMIKHIRDEKTVAKLRIHDVSKAVTEFKKKSKLSHYGGRPDEAFVQNDGSKLYLYVQGTGTWNEKRKEYDRPPMKKLANVGESLTDKPIRISVTEGWRAKKSNFLSNMESFNEVEIKTIDDANSFTAYASRDGGNEEMAYTIGKNEAGKA